MQSPSPIPFRRLVHWVGLALALALAGPSRGDQSESTVDEPPFRSGGDVAFFVDVSGYRATETGSTDLEFYLAVANDELEFRPEGTGFGGDLLLEIDAHRTVGSNHDIGTHTDVARDVTTGVAESPVGTIVCHLK